MCTHMTSFFIHLIIINRCTLSVFENDSHTHYYTSYPNTLEFFGAAGNGMDEGDSVETRTERKKNLERYDERCASTAVLM